MTDRPNILIFMVDQLSGTLFPDGPAEWLHAPNLRRLAEKSARFANAYAPFPLCAPARAGFMAGALPFRIGVFDNAAEFGSDTPTFAHQFRRAGYQTCLCGKMHFVGADQLHGFEERLTTDIYPADYGWTPDYSRPGERINWWYHNLGSVKSAGVSEVSHQLEYDDEVAHYAIQRIHRYRTGNDDRPWLMVVSFTHPHDPYVSRRRFWGLYESCEHLKPDVGTMAYEEMDPHSQRIFDANDWCSYELTATDVARSRRGYFANISYIDEKIGEVLASLDSMQLSDRTVVAFLSDHGDMLGERGLWFKMHFYEGSARVPFMIGGTGIRPGRVDIPVSIIDAGPTLADLAGIPMDDVCQWQDGDSLLAAIDGCDDGGPVFLEYSAEASVAPLVGVRVGSLKYVHCDVDPPLLFDLDADPHELINLAEAPEYASERRRLDSMVRATWKLDKIDAAIRQSQEKRLFVYEALRNGHYFPWDYQPLRQASERYMRNHMDLNELDSGSRFPPSD